MIPNLNWQAKRTSLSLLSWAVAATIGLLGFYVAWSKSVATYQAEMHRDEIIDSAINALWESADHGFLALNHEGKVKEWNPALARWTGYSAEEIVGDTLEKVMEPKIFRNHHDHYLQWINQEHVEDKTLVINCYLVSKDRNVYIPVRVTARKVKFREGDPEAIALLDLQHGIIDMTNKEALGSLPSLEAVDSLTKTTEAKPAEQ